MIDKINTFPHFGQKIAYLRKIDPFVFEELLLEGFERRGFEVIRNRRYTGDGGIDGRVKIDGQTWLIRPNAIATTAVGHVRDFSDLLNATGARGFSAIPAKRAKAKSLIRGDSRMILVSGQKLLDLIATDAPFIRIRDTGHRPKWFILNRRQHEIQRIRRRPACTAAGAPCPGQPTDYDRFCNVSGIASHGETYRVSDRDSG
ncbi:restriction endonuclease [Staphylococcus epidermidis]|nr:restriction endonuclease [Staphylococcus epidermidis]